MIFYAEPRNEGILLGEEKNSVASESGIIDRGDGEWSHGVGVPVYHAG